MPIPSHPHQRNAPPTQPTPPRQSRQDLLWFMLFAATLLLLLSQLQQPALARPLTTVPPLSSPDETCAAPFGQATSVSALQQRERADARCARQAALARGSQ